MSAQPDDTPEQPPYVTPWDRLVDAARRLRAGHLTVAGLRISSLSAGQRPSGYGFGWLFVGLRAWSAFHVLQWLLGHGFTDWFDKLYLVGAVWILTTAAAAGFRRAWGWYVLVIAIPAEQLLVGIAKAAWLAWSAGDPAAIAVVKWTMFSNVPADLGDVLLAGLWLAYFYRRRAMFAARRGWGWLETTFPRIAGRATFDPQVLGLPWVAWPVLSLGLVLWTHRWLWGR